MALWQWHFAYMQRYTYICRRVVVVYMRGGWVNVWVLCLSFVIVCNNDWRARAQCCCCTWCLCLCVCVDLESHQLSTNLLSIRVFRIFFKFRLTTANRFAYKVDLSDQRISHRPLTVKKYTFPLSFFRNFAFSLCTLDRGSTVYRHSHVNRLCKMKTKSRFSYVNVFRLYGQSYFIYAWALLRVIC